MTLTARIKEAITTVDYRGFTNTELANRLQSTPASVSSLTKKLADRGLIARTQDANGTWIYKGIEPVKATR